MQSQFCGMVVSTHSWEWQYSAWRGTKVTWDLICCENELQWQVCGKYIYRSQRFHACVCMFYYIYTYLTDVSH